MSRRSNSTRKCGYETGIVLITTMMMIALLSSLIVSLMQGVLLYWKASNNMILQHQHFYQLESLGQQLSLLKTLPHSACISKEADPNQLIRLLLAKKGCLFVYQNQQFYYWVSDLGLYPCLQIPVLSPIKRAQDEVQNSSGSHHWLLSIIDEHQAILQFRIAKPSFTQRCQLIEQRIQQGIISWRYLYAAS